MAEREDTRTVAFVDDDPRELEALAEAVGDRYRVHLRLWPPADEVPLPAWLGDRPDAFVLDMHLPPRG